MKILSNLKYNIIYYLYENPKYIYRSIKHWFYCNFNKYHWKLLKTAWNSYPWDGSFLTILEEIQIDKQIHWFEHHQVMIDEQYEQIIRTLRWAKYCIHIINNDGTLYHFDGEITYKDIEDSNFKEVETTDLKYVYDGPRVNFRNAERFLNNTQMNIAKKMPSELYLAKCKHLYYKIREHYTDYWWD